MKNLVLSQSTVALPLRSDGEVLASFIQQQQEQDFVELTRRHGAMVFSLARRWTGSVADAEDVYQATFLLLARKANSLLQRTSLAGWLHQSVRRICSDLRRGEKRRRLREQHANQLKEASTGSEPMDQSRETLRLVDRELGKLPQAMREPLLLQIHSGMSLQQIADRLKIAPGTVASRINRGKQRLKARLIRNGVATSVILACFSGVTQAYYQPYTLSLAAIVAASKASTTELVPLVSQGTLQLYKGALSMSWIEKSRWIAAGLAVTIGLGYASFNWTEAKPSSLSSLESNNLVQDDSEVKKLQGTWYCVAVVPGGRGGPSREELENMKNNLKFVFTNTEMKLLLPGRDIEGKIKLDNSTSPKRIELTSNAEKDPLQAVYSVDGDVLVFTFNEGSGRGFPKSLAVTEDVTGAMFVLQKKPYAANANEGKMPSAAKTPAAAPVGRMLASNNLRQLGVAIHNYHDTFGKMPQNVFSPDGKPLLSWRVALLPFLEQDSLAKQFKMDEPWDSDHNKKLIDKMPKMFEIDPESKKNFTTAFQVFHGEGALFDPKKLKLTFADIKDGTSNTIMIVESKEQVTWSKPDDLPFDSSKPVTGVGNRFGRGTMVIMADGSTREVPNNISNEVWKALITRAGAETIDIWNEERDTPPKNSKVPNSKSPPRKE